jgi:hypothetical protein
MRLPRDVATGRSQPLAAVWQLLAMIILVPTSKTVVAKAITNIPKSITECLPGRPFPIAKYCL